MLQFKDDMKKESERALFGTILGVPTTILAPLCLAFSPLKGFFTTEQLIDIGVFFLSVTLFCFYCLLSARYKDEFNNILASKIDNKDEIYVTR